MEERLFLLPDLKTPVEMSVNGPFTVMGDVNEIQAVAWTQTAVRGAYRTVLTIFDAGGGEPQDECSIDFTVTATAFCDEEQLVVDPVVATPGQTVTVSYDVDTDGTEQSVVVEERLFLLPDLETPVEMSVNGPFTVMGIANEIQTVAWMQTAVRGAYRTVLTIFDAGASRQSSGSAT